MGEVEEAAKEAAQKLFSKFCEASESVEESAVENAGIEAAAAHYGKHETTEDIELRTTNKAKDDGNMQILNFHMFHIGLLPGVF